MPVARPTARPYAPMSPPAAPMAGLTIRRLTAMRAGYLLMGIGLAVVKWPQLRELATLPVYEGVTLCLLTAMSVLALLGLRHPVTLLPVLLFETIWKLLWLSMVALPNAMSGGLDPATQEIAVNCALVTVIIAVIPWPAVWRGYVRAPATPFRARP